MAQIDFKRIAPRALIIAAWAVLALFLIAPAAELPAKLDPRPIVFGAQHQQVDAIIAADFDTIFANPIILVIDDIAPRTPSGAASLQVIVAAIENEPGVARVLSYLTAGDDMHIGAEGEGAIVLIAPDVGAAPEQLVEHLRPAAAAAAPEHTLRWTGEALLNAELRQFAAEEAASAEARTLPLVIVLALIAFGSIIAALLPVGIGVLALALALALVGIAADHASVSIVVINVVSMLGLGLTIDYALLMVSRFREELAHAPPPEAAWRAANTAGGAIALSGACFAIALGGLLLVPVNEIRSVAMGGLAVTAAAMLASTTLLPAILSFVGLRVDFLSPLRRFAKIPDGIWEAWARTIFARPLLIVALGLAPLLLLAVHAARLDVNLPRGGNWLPSSSESVQALRVMNQMERGGVFHTLKVIVSFSDESALQSQANWRALAAFADDLRVDPRVGYVRAITDAAPADTQPWAHLDALPAPLRAAFLSRDRDRALIAITPAPHAEPFELAQLARDIRAMHSPIAGATHLVGGGPALNADYTDAIANQAWPVAAFILGVTFVGLAIGYRSLLLPLKAALLNLISVAASLGALVLVFQDGWGASLLGLDGPLHGVFPNVPILVFAIVYGLSMDYEVFLFNRVVEAHRAGAGDRPAMSLALRRTAGVITSAAAIMIVVFAAFMQGEFLLIKMLGFTLATAILIDATLVRLLVAPAIFALAGRWNWWPGKPVAAQTARNAAIGSPPANG